MTKINNKITIICPRFTSQSYISARKNENAKPHEVVLTPRSMPMNHAIPQLDLGDTCRRFSLSTANHVHDIDLPLMRPRCFSRESCSSDLSIISSSNKVDPMPVNVTPANIPRLENPINTTTCWVSRGRKLTLPLVMSCPSRVL